MILSRRAALNGVQLDRVDDRVIIRSIEEAAGKENVGAVSLGRADGTRITGKRRDTVEVQVRFALCVHSRDMQERSRLLENVNRWAARGVPGYLTVNYRPERVLYVDEAVFPGGGDAGTRSNEYTITFRAHAVPYWQQETPTEAVTGTGTSETATITAEGSARTVCDAVLRNMSGAQISTATIIVGTSVMAFTGLELGEDERLEIRHDDRGILRIVAAGGGSSARSLMAKRSAESADDLYVNPGVVNAVQFTAQRACRLTVTCRGRFV